MTGEAPYARIVAEIRDSIVNGDLRVGDKVPSTREITRRWGVAMATATKVLATLRQQGLVRPAPGIGTVVAAPDAPVAAPRRPGRRPDAPDLSREQLVRAAVALADREGLSGLSMRRIAAEVGVATMSLYRHVRSKDELVMYMMDAVFAAYPLPEAADCWRTRLEALARLQWDIYRRHPWLAPVMSFTRPPLARSAMAHTEWSMRALDGRGLSTSTVFLASVTLANYVRGTAVNFEPEALAEQDTGLTDDEWMHSQRATFEQILGSGQFPMMIRAVTEPGFSFDLDGLFEAGLRQLLDGLASRLDT